MAKYIIHTGNNIDTLKNYPDNHFDSIVTDPPYGIEFLGKDWDSNTGAIETWEQCYRVLKPGGYILAFSAARTYHNLATNIEGVGFEIRDQIMWIYASGFPKAQDVGKAIDKRAGNIDSLKGTGDRTLVSSEGKGTKTPRCKKCNRHVYLKDKCTDDDCGLVYTPQNTLAQQWAGWKTALKPAHEPIVMARKPFRGSCVDNVLTHGVGALNIDATRVEYDGSKLGNPNTAEGIRQQKGGFDNGMLPSQPAEWHEQGRFPSNVIGEVTDYQKYFYCPKVSRAERHIGFADPGARHPGADGGGYQVHDVNHTEITLNNNVRSAIASNNHPTVKPVALMRYLVTLVTPEGGKVLDPFTGSGSTGMAAVELGYEFTGCELDPDYVDIATKRIQAWYNKTDVSGETLPSEWFNEVN